jgi:hypothetical protein
MLLIDKVKDDYKKAWFYVYETVENGWSRNMLLNGLGTDLYERQGHALTNFKRTLPEDTSDLAKGAQRCQEPPCPQAVSARIPASANCFLNQYEEKHREVWWYRLNCLSLQQNFVKCINC